MICGNKLPKALKCSKGGEVGKLATGKSEWMSMKRECNTPSRDTMQEVAVMEGNTTLSVPFLRMEKVLAVIEDHLLDTGFEDNAAHGPLLPCTIPSPAPTTRPDVL